MKYAVDTSVSVAKTRTEIQQVVSKAGATAFGIMESVNMAQVVFELKDRRVMFDLLIPLQAKFRSQQAWEQAQRSLWRALFLTIKAKLVSVSSGVETFEEAFLSQVVVRQDGRMKRFGEIAVAAIQEAYSGKAMPPLLGAGS